MARKLWSEGVHVALIIIDGIVDLPRTRKAMRPDDAFVDPTGVAEIAYQLCRQDRRAWSFEVEARPYRESLISCVSISCTNRPTGIQYITTMP
jgi:hypothetical protein